MWRPAPFPFRLAYTQPCALRIIVACCVRAPRAARRAPAQVFLACGPMSESYCKPVQDVIEAVTAKGVKAHFLDQVRVLKQGNR